jgi:hypothetical protein
LRQRRIVIDAEIARRNKQLEKRQASLQVQLHA